MNFKDWLLASGKAESTVNSICSRINRLEEEYLIDHEYEKDRCQSLLEELTYTSEDVSHGLLPKTCISMRGNYVTGLQTLKRALVLYIEYLNAIRPVVLHSQAIPLSGIFEGNFNQFNRYTGPMWCKKIQQITKTLKKKASVCECCLEKKELHAAHRHGLDRLNVIEKILIENYQIAPDFYRVDLTEFEHKFIEAHKPYEDTFYFLCQKCHSIYDNDDIVSSNKILETILNNRCNTH